MQLTVLGSGDAFGGCGCNAAYAVDGRLLVDCAAPPHVLLPRAGLRSADVRAILLTHFHADHTFMLPIFLGTLMVVRNLAPDPSELPADVVIAGPVGTREYVERLISDGYGSELLDLISERVRPRYVVLQDGSDETIAGYRVRAHAVVHSLGPSLAYAVSDGSGTTIGFSGDTTMCAGLRRVVALSNLMVCECTSWDAPIPSHLWQGEVSELIASHPQTKFLLSHLTERRTLPGAFIAHDLLTLDVSA